MHRVERSTAPLSDGSVVDAVRRALPRPGGLSAIAWPAPDLPPGALLASAPDAPGFCWASPRSALEAVGVVARVPPERAAAALEAVEGAPARLVGGLPFAPLGTDGPWSAFDSPTLFLPRWSLTGPEAERQLVRVLGPDDDPEAVARELERLRAVTPTALPLPRTLEVRPFPREPWVRHVETIRAAIRAGRFEKLVAARATDLRFDGPVDPWTAFLRLRAAHAGCHVFLLREGGAAFLGASPETLLSRRGDELLTHALAGSRPVGAPSLHASPKDLHEHELVVRHIREALAPLSTTVAAEGLRERAVGDIVHLETPIRATLRPGVATLTVARALHPTPAVGGLPHRAAHAWIVEHEPLERGWYAGAIGWLDAQGNAELAVALRSGVVAGDRARAFAGAGIVEASDPDAEYDETTLKSGPLLRALGAA